MILMNKYLNYQITKTSIDVLKRNKKKKIIIIYEKILFLITKKLYIKKKNNKKSFIINKINFIKEKFKLKSL